MILAARAQEATPSAPVDDSDKAVTKLTANVGGNLSVGTAESVAINGGADFSHKQRRNQLSGVAAAAIGFGAVDTNGDGFLASGERCLGVTACAPTTQKASVDLRYDRFVTKGSSVYVLAGALHDKFGGFDHRVHVQVGFARQVVDAERTKLKLDIGLDVANEDYVEGVAPSSTRLMAAQVAAERSHKINANVAFSDTLTVYEPLVTQPDGSPFAPYFTDIRVTNIETLTAKLSGKLSLNLSDTLAWRNEPIAAPEGVAETRAPVDNTLTVAFVASIL
jgi:hypothetical protein